MRRSLLRRGVGDGLRPTRPAAGDLGVRPHVTVRAAEHGPPLPSEGAR